MKSSNHIIGFAKKQYHLWSTVDEIIYITDIHGVQWPSHTTTLYTYHNPISEDLNTTKELYPTLVIENELKGKSHSFSINRKDDLSPRLIKFKKYKGYTLTEIAQFDIAYLVWLEKYTRNKKTKKLISKLPEFTKYKIDLEVETARKYNEIRSTFLKSGEYTIYFKKNPDGNLDKLYFDISFDLDCPQFLIDRLGQFKKTYEENRNPYLEPLATAGGVIDGTWYLIVFPFSQTVKTMYPYVMGYINGNYRRINNKSFTASIKPIGFAHNKNENRPEYQILMVDK